MTMAGPSTLWPGASCRACRPARGATCRRKKTRVRRAGAGSSPRGVLRAFSLKRGAAADRFHRHGLDHQRLCLRSMKPNCALCARSKPCCNLPSAADCGPLQRRTIAAGTDDQRRVGAGVADMGPHMNRDLVFQRRPGRRPHLSRSAPADARPLRALPCDLLPNGSSIACCAHAPDIGEAHAVGGEQRRQRMDQHARHAERVGDEAGMLAASAAEAIERIARHIVAALHRNLLDRVRHVFDRDLDEAVGDLFGRAAVADLVASLANAARTASASSGRSCCGPKIFGKKSADQLADHDIGVGHRERPAAAIAFRAPDWRRPIPGRRESARRRNAGSSRRPPRRCGSASSARACARRRLRSRRRARIRRRNATRRSRCRPCRSRSSGRSRPSVRSRPCRPLPPPVRTGSRPCREIALPPSGRPTTS